MSAVRHLAVIPDGNRRWAREQGLAPSDGHRRGIDNVGRIADAAWRRDVESFTFWWGSPANLRKRSAGEVAVITGCLSEWLSTKGAALLQAHDARFDVYGRWEELCPEIAPGVADARRAAGEGPRRLTLLMAYDGREEIRDAAARLGGAGADERAFAEAMWTATLPPVDLLIRTGGEPHLSAGFMLWRIAEAQLAFPSCHWPALDEARLHELLETFEATGRRFGA